MTLRLLWRVPEKVLAHAERGEELVIQVIAIGDNDEGRVFHRRMLDDLSGVENHQKTLA